MTTSTVKSRRWPSFRFSLSTLMVTVTVLGLYLGFRVSETRRHRAAVDAVSKWDRSSVWYNYQVDGTSGRVDQYAEPPQASTLWAMFGFGSSIDVDHLLANDQEITDADLVHLESLENIRHLALNCPKVTDDGLKHLRQCRHLVELSIGNNKNITDDGLMNLAVLKELSQLRLEWLPNVTDEGRERLQRALPHCTIRYSLVGEGAGTRVVQKL